MNAFSATAILSSPSSDADTRQKRQFHQAKRIRMGDVLQFFNNSFPISTPFSSEILRKEGGVSP